MADCWLKPLQCVKECLWPCVKPHIDYWWCFDGNVQGLRDEMGRLETEMSNRNQKIEEARLRAEIATTDVKKWSNEGTQKLEEATSILQGCDDLKVWKIIHRYNKGKAAIETAEGISKLREKGNSIRIADPSPPAAMVSISHAPTLAFQSRKSMEEDIMKSLKDGNVRMIAICGPGGVGKTTMAERIEDRVRTEKLFDEVVTVVVSQPIDTFKIQKRIAEKLGLSLGLDGREHKLRTRLMDSKKKLIIFDDVWESLKLNDIGIPYGGCKIILTSRLKDVCEEMEANEVIEIQVLDKNEAWTLFREKSGDCVDDLDLCPIAKKVAAECKGLPIALVTVGKALTNKNRETWEAAFSQLRRSNPKNLQQVLKNVYMPLKLSYDFLETEAKDIFLLCCLFPEDVNIRIEDLALLSFGLGLLKEVNYIEDGRNTTYLLLERLRSCFLLMTGWKKDYVKMHDVVRDVAIFIGSKEKQGFLKSLEVSSEDSRNCNWMSVDISIANSKLLIGLDFPNLRLLMILNFNNSEFSQGFDVNDICFEGMKVLTVLYFSSQKYRSLPSSMEFLKQLRKLHLDNCQVKDISVVGKLASLEILRILHCHDIEELPADVGKLKFLRLLELNYCRKLKRIVAGVISSLVGLEELQIVDCFNKWEAKGNVSEERNASLSELESLPKLISLEIDIFDPNLVAEEISLSKQLRRYKIRFNNRRFSNYPFSILGSGDESSCKRLIILNLPREVILGNWIRRLVKNTQSLLLHGDGSNNLNLGETESLRYLRFLHCSTVEKLVNAVDCKFLLLEHLELNGLRELEEIIDGTIPEGSNSCQNLQSLKVQYLRKLRYLWKSPNQNVYLGNLKSIYIFSCPNLRYLFSMAKVSRNEMESNKEASIIEFPKLMTLQLRNLPNHLGFAPGVEIIKFPQLRKIKIRRCPKLRTKIDISPTCMIENLVVDDCDTIEEIFWHDGNHHIIFQELRKLKLSGLPSLTTFYRGVESIKFPKLEELTIRKLPRLNSFVTIDSEPNPDDHSIHFFFHKKVEMIGLKKLELRDLPGIISKIWCHHIPISFFHNLESLSIDKVGGIRNSISCSIAKGLVNLNTLEIDECEEMIYVIEDEIDVYVDTEASIIEFPMLMTLQLCNLPNLLAFTQGVEIIKFPKLEKLRIRNLPRLNSFVPIDSEPNHDDHSIHFLCHTKVEMISLKELELEDCSDKISKIWCRHIPISFFHNLERLSITQVDGIRNSISSSVAKALVNLNSLFIAKCKGMVDVIEDETHETVNSVFPNLKYLSLLDNCKLRSFCQWKHSFELPSLESVVIDDCPLVKTFTFGSLSTPKLYRFQINNKDIEMKDLNDGIHHFISTEDANEDENNEDEKNEYSAENEKEIEGDEKTESGNNNRM